MDPVKLQKLIADYKASHPSVKHNTDAEIISIMCNDASEIRLMLHNSLNCLQVQIIV